MSAPPFLWRIRVYYEDTDATGLVYHADYLRFFERARTEWLRSLGFEQSALRRTDSVIFAVVSANLRYLEPARVDELLEVSVALRGRARASLTLAQSISRDPATVLCEADIRVACLDAASYRPKRIPPKILAELSDGD
jgi:acyl-CoA thioester hydrolase